MGLKTMVGATPRLSDAGIAKNYLDEGEIEILHRIVMAYLEFAELQALNRRPMTMAGWFAKLDAFLKLSGGELLNHAGRVSHDAALEKAWIECDRYRQAHLNDTSQVERAFLEATQGIEKSRPRLGSTKGSTA